MSDVTAGPAGTPGSFAGRVAIVTGCGRETGIGYAIASTLARQGASVVMTDVEDKGALNLHEPAGLREAGAGLEQLVAGLRDEGRAATAVYADVGRAGVAEDVVRSALDAYGRIDILVNNAAAPQGEDRRTVDLVPDSAYESLVGVNLYGVFQLCRAVVPTMREQHYGRIVNISSMYARRGWANSALYAMTKAGVIGLTQSIAVELGPDGITANAVCPGFVNTSRVQSGMARRGITDEAEWFKVVGQVPAGRNARPEDIAGAVAYLASEQASYVTAQSIAVDGGVLGF